MAFYRGPFALLTLLLLLNSVVNATEEKTCKAWLVQSIPTDMPELRQVKGVFHTGDVFQWLAGNATKSLDVTAQYWEFLAEPGNPLSGDYGFTRQQMEHFGAPVGKAVYDSLLEAANKDVPIRILQHAGFFPSFDAESAAIAAGRPNVQNRTLHLVNWWGSGVVHAKVWIADKKDAYIGSANNDWKSLTQVKELGIYFTDCPEVAKQLEVFFNNFWTLTTLNASLYTKSVWDQQWQVNRTVPCWSHFLTPVNRCESPIADYVLTHHVQGYPYLNDPFFFPVKIETAGWHGHSNGAASLAYVSMAPPEISSHKYQTDEQGWVDTILSVKTNGTVRINTMDWLGQSQYAQSTVFWPVLSDAIAKVVLAKQAKVKVLVAHWSNTLIGTDQYLYFLNYTNSLCLSSPYNQCVGTVEVKYFEVPDWDKTGPAINATTGKSTGAKYPDYTRVNHGKYVVSDVRANIGTSNLVWDYFYTTAGASFGTYDPRIVSQLQDVFDSDWESPYAVPLPATLSSQ